MAFSTEALERLYGSRYWRYRNAAAAMLAALLPGVVWIACRRLAGEGRVLVGFQWGVSVANSWRPGVLPAELMEVLRCPLTRSRLRQEGDSLVAEVGGLRYPIRDGFPVLLVEGKTVRVVYSVGGWLDINSVEDVISAGEF